MTTNIFVTLVIVLSAISALVTEAIKKATGKKFSSNLIALIDALIVGCGGTAVAYMILAIPFTALNIVLLVVMGFAIWVGSMVGYDKVVQLIEQILTK